MARVDATPSTQWLQTVTKLDVGHDDLIHDVAYDFYGRRLATCSSDLYIKVFDWVPPENGSGAGAWVRNDQFKAHDASVLRVTWAHPEFGQVLASASADGHVRIWEEQEQETKQSGKRWLERAQIFHLRSVQDVKFAPKHLGLKLAACVADGTVNVSEAADVMNLASWTPMIYRYQEQSREWTVVDALPGHNDVVHDVCWAPAVGRSFHLIATASRDGRVRIFRVRGDVTKERPTVETLAAFTDHEAPVRTSFRVQVAGDEQEKTLWRASVTHTYPLWMPALTHLFAQEVWKVEWNITGTLLSSSGDDGKVRLWQANYLGEWACIAVINAGEAVPSGMS